MVQADLEGSLLSWVQQPNLKDTLLFKGTQPPRREGMKRKKPPSTSAILHSQQSVLLPSPLLNQHEAQIRLSPGTCCYGLIIVPNLVHVPERVDDDLHPHPLLLLALPALHLPPNTRRFLFTLRDGWNGFVDELAKNQFPSD
jgi:hypothetical protein